MAPKPDIDLKKNKASFTLSLKGLFGKSFSKHKQYKKNDCDLTFDAVPDFPKRADESGVKQNHNVTDPFINLNTNKTSQDTENVTGKNDFYQCDENVNNKFKREENCQEEKSDSIPRDKERKQKGFKKNSKSKDYPSILNQTSVVVNGGVGIHFGNVFNNVNNAYYDGSSMNAEHINKVEKTEAIKDLLKSGNKVEACHLQLLSSHLGDKWQEVGVALGFTMGELHCVRNQTKKLQERAFQMLMLWSQKAGDGATVGELCKLLWRGKVVTAREAVSQLSLNIDLFQ